MRAILKRMLTELGYEVLEAGNGREGLECLRKSGTVDLALVDWNMLEMNGLDFLRAVRKEPTYGGMIEFVAVKPSRRGRPRKPRRPPPDESCQWPAH
jgi:two-component system chemotaxis response regulator CheY